MPLVRVEVRNEYGLGAPELYMEANRDDPKELLEGVAVSGLVGILRQLGDLAEFAAEVFHGLQEQVMITSSRSHKLMGRVQRIEAALPSMEKLVLAQRSHLHFAYTTGANWHARVRCEQSHFIYSDLPRFIMDSYEQCRWPPRLNLLDKYDPGGPGSCLKRYSDPSFFKRASTGSEGIYVDKVLRDKKDRKIKKRRSWQKTGEVSRRPSMSNYSRRMQFASVNVHGQTSPCQTVSTYHGLKSDLGDLSFSLDSRNGSVDLDGHPGYSMPHEEHESKESPYPSRMLHSDSHDYDFVDENSASINDALKSDFGDRSISLDSRNWTADLERGSHPSYSMQHEEQASEESPYPSRMLPSDPHDNAFIDERGESIDDAQKSDFGDHSISLNSRNESVDLEHVSYPSYSMHHEEQEAKVCYSCPSRMQKYDDNHFSFSDEKDAILYDDIHSSIPEEKTGPRSFCVSWDEKTQLLEPSSKECNPDETSEMHSTNFDPENIERGAAHFKTAGGYIQDESLGKFSSELDRETEESRATHLEISKSLDHDESSEILSTNLDLETEEQRAIQLKNAGQTYVHLGNENLSLPAPDKIQLGDFESGTIGQQMISHLDKENVPVSTSGDSPHDDVESETDNYTDALNSIDSEYETDLDYQTKLEVEPYSDKDNRAIENGVDIFTMPHSGSHLSNSESLIPIGSSPNNDTFRVDPSPVLPETCFGGYSSPHEKTSEDISDTVPFESYAFSQPPQIANEPLNPTSLTDVDLLKNGDVFSSSNVKSVMSSVSSSDSRQHSSSVPIVDKITSSSSELQKPPPEHSGITSIKFWTNGSLLGLEPSKPPDFSLLNVASSVSPESKDDEFSSSIHRQDARQESSNSSEEAGIPDFQDDRKGGILAKRAPLKSFSADLGVNLQKLSDSCNQSYNSNSQNYVFSQTSATVQPVSPGIEFVKASQEKSGNSSQMLQLGNRLFQNGLHRKPSLDKDESSNPTTSLNDNGFVQNSRRDFEFKTFSGRSKEMPGIGSPMMSPPSSPPLGHMRISFQPINGCEVPMQLKFPDGNSSQEGGRDLFPSFQLVPEPTIPLHDAGSDSDDDTFCRSSPYGSDCLSHQSDSNSERWESSESPGSKDRELYDALRTISLTESASTSLGIGQTAQGEINNNCRPQISFARNSTEHSLSGYLFDLPSLDTLHPSFREELRNDFDAKNHDEPNCSKELTPSTPPLPPPQWRSMKPQFDLAEDRQVSVSDDLSHAFDRKLGSTVTQQPKPAPLKQDQIIEVVRTMKSKQQDLQKTSGQKEANQTVYGEGMEEKEDFLHQIRTKSFSLRRTVTEKPIATAAPPKSVQVSAILEKANAIRQAVGSDDGEDNWSDT